MKMKYIGSLLLFLVAFAGCDDDTGSLGMEMLPSSDEFTANTATFEVTTQSVAVESVFAKTNTGYVGRFTDPDFGPYEASFLTEFYCPEEFALPEVYETTETDEDGKPSKGTGLLVKDSVVAVNLVVYYSSWFGDSLNACRMSVYELDKKLDDNRYTDIDPTEYYDESNPALLLGSKAYSAYDTSVSDSVRNATDTNGNPIYSPHVAFPLDPETFGEDRILNVYREHPDDFKDIFTNDFHGVYIKNDYGDGTVLYIERVDIQMSLCCHYTDDETGAKLLKKDGTDSLYNSTQTLFASTKEVVQASRFVNPDLKKKVEQENEWTYIKSPAGIFTQATMPYDEIHEQLANDTLNSVSLTFTNYRQEETYDFSMSVPSEVMLIRKQDMEKFFENNEVADNVTSYIVSHNNVGTNQYTFKNIARLVTTCINEKEAARKEDEENGGQWDEEKWMAEHPDWDKVLLIPVAVTYGETTSSGTTPVISVRHDLKPAYAKLKGGPAQDVGGTVKNPLTLEVTYTSFHD